jgi:hypothetical protein
MHATLPFLGGADERRALLGGITFLDLTDGPVQPGSIADWFDEHVVGLGCCAPLGILGEPPVGSVPLRPSGEALPVARRDLTRVVIAARARVVGALRGFIGAPSDDRFLRAAIFLGRVRRQNGSWIARPEPTAPLSGVVLSLFAVSILSERSFHDQNLCVCEVCGRVSFDPRPVMRKACPGHAPRVSGVSERVGRRNAASG